MFGAPAAELVAAGEFWKMVAFSGPQIGAIKIRDAIGKLKAVRPDGNLVRTARALGISFGD
jgi:6-phosphofructokinase 1